MSGSFLVGIDSGLTVTKAAAFDLDGRCLGVGSAPSKHRALPGGFVETDAEQQWRDVGTASRAALAAAGLTGRDIAAVGVTAHGDCVYLADADGRPVRPAIPSLDFRGAAIARQWRDDGVSRRLLDIIGEPPHGHHVHATLRWLLDHEPDSLHAARWMLFAKDWLKLRLTGTVSTDPTDATAGFTDVRTGSYSDEALRACGLGVLRGKLPPVRPPTDVVGAVTREAADATGLAAGTPVVCGVHDITAAALGGGLTDSGTALLVAGTYSVNALLADRPQPDERWLCRHWAGPGRWLHLATSATSASNLAWMAEQLGPPATDGSSPYDAIDAEVAEVLDDEGGPVFHPFLFGTPADERASAALLGVRPWHRRAHVFRAVLEGVVFAHRAHLDTLAACASVERVVLAGGATRSVLWSQLFADVLGLPVAVSGAAEAGALGVAACAATGIGAYPSLDDAVRAVVRTSRVHSPDAARHERADRAYRRFAATVGAARPVWSALEDDGSNSRP